MALRGPLHNPRCPLSTGSVSRTSFRSLIPATWRRSPSQSGRRKLKAISAALTASPGIMFRHGSWGKCQGCLLSTFPFPLDEALLRNVIVSRPVKDLSQCVIDKRGSRMWGMWRQRALSWRWLLIEFACRSVGCLFCAVNKVSDLKGFLVSFTSREALTIQFFGELSCCNGNVLRGKAGVRRDINTH